MLLANQFAAKFIFKTCGNISILRCHDIPSYDKLLEFKTFLEQNDYGHINIDSRDDILTGFTKILQYLNEEIQKTNDKNFHNLSPKLIILELLMLKTFSSAE